MQWVKFLLSLLFTSALVYLLSIPLTPLNFPLGHFINPYNGFWQNATSQYTASLQDTQLKGLLESVSIVFDERHIPHIFAQSEADLYFAQGYIEARDRLWQMEFQSLSAAGRLSEVMPVQYQDQLLDLDRKKRRKGLLWASQKSLTRTLEHPPTRKILQAYTAGVNAFINDLTPANYPLEYKIFNYAPEPWTPLKTILLAKYFADLLSGNSNDISNTYAYQIWGKALYDTLYSSSPYTSEPVIPAGTQWPFTPKEIPQPPASYTPDSLLAFEMNKGSYGYNSPHTETRGSNNWAVAPTHTRDQRTFLASDPHLPLNMPSLWYELQLNSPEQNVYGVSIPGVPGIIIGFNDSIAWGITNGARDLMDFYRITFKDTKQDEYQHGGAWTPIQKQVDTFRLKGETFFYDTVSYTALGPILYDNNFGNTPYPFALKWVAHEPSNELRAFYELNKAQNYQAFTEAISHFQTPGQNFVFASHTGDIAIWHQGKYVQRWPLQGQFVLDAGDSTNLWQAYIPQPHNPHIQNPTRGFVSSANQAPTDSTYPYPYQAATQFQQYRHLRLNQLLSQSDSMTLEDMQSYQQDTYSPMAAVCLPILLSALDSINLSDNGYDAYIQLKNWDYHYDATEIAPTLFQVWWDTLYHKIWYDELDRQDLPLTWPSEAVTVDLLKKVDHFSFFDDTTTPSEENKRSLINFSFKAAVQHLFNPNTSNLQRTWGHWKMTHIRHLARLGPSFGSFAPQIGGYKNILNATQKYSGPSWRMIVAFGDSVEAYGIYPGGQSGNPGSSEYDRFVANWAKGIYYPIAFAHGVDDLTHNTAYILNLTN